MVVAARAVLVAPVVARASGRGCPCRAPGSMMTLSCLQVAAAMAVRGVPQAAPVRGS
jgi:hypothetical protein